MKKLILVFIIIVGLISCICTPVKDTLRSAVEDMFQYTNNQNFSYIIRWNTDTKYSEVYFKYKDKLNTACGLTLNKKDLISISNAQNTLFINEFIKKLNNYKK